METISEIKRKAAMVRWGNVSPIRRFLSYVQIDIRSGCWLWLGSLNAHGYGQFHDSARKQNNVHAFRWAYEYFKGPLPDGYEPDHLCRVRCCVNPDHLEAVTRRENSLRGISPCAINAAKVVCKWGHNRWGKAKDGRYCMDCKVLRERRKSELRQRRIEEARKEQEEND